MDKILLTKKNLFLHVTLNLIQGLQVKSQAWVGCRPESFWHMKPFHKSINMSFKD